MTEDKPTLLRELQKMNMNFQKLEQISDKQKKRNFKLPWKANVGKAKVKDNWITILLVKSNRNIKFLKGQIIEHTVMVDDQPYLSTTDAVLYYKGKPFVIQPEWSVYPFIPHRHFKQTRDAKELAVGHRLMLNRMKSEQVKQKKGISMGMIIIIILLILGGLYYLISGQGGL